MSLDVYKLIWGYILLIGLFVLAGVIALGKVEEKSSFGLGQITGSLLTLSGFFGSWAFSNGKDHKNKL